MPRTMPATERKIDQLFKKRSFYIAVALLVLLSLQLLSGTDPLFALEISLFGLLTAATIEAIGGLGTLMGLCVGMLAMQHILISQVAKLILWQPAEIPLAQPLTTGAVYDLGMASMWLAALVWRRSGLARRKPMFAVETEPNRLFWMAVLCTVLATARSAIMARSGVDAQTGQMATGGIMGPLKSVVFLGPLSIACGTAYMILSTRGRKSVGWLNVIALLASFLVGMLGAAREGMAIGFVTYYTTCIAFNFKFKFPHFAFLAFSIYAAEFILFPYALIGRGLVRTPNMDTNIKRATSLIIDVVSDPMRYQKQIAEGESKQSTATRRLLYYGKSMQTLDRFSVIAWADPVINATVLHGTIGMETIEPGFDMVLPRFLNVDKPIFSPSNRLAHRAPGLVGKHDRVTGITLGLVCDAFSSFGWAGEAIIPFLILFIMTTFFRLIFNDHLKRNVFALALALSFPTMFSEGIIANHILLAFQVSVIFIVVLGFLNEVTNMLQVIRISRQEPRGAASSLPAITQ